MARRAAVNVYEGEAQQKGGAMDEWTVRLLLAAAGLAAVAVCLMPALRHLKISERSIKWALAAHVFFIAGLGLAVAPHEAPIPKTETPPLLVDLFLYEPPEKKKPKPLPVMAQAEPMYVQPPKTETTPEELPTLARRDSITSQLLQSSTRSPLSDPRRLLAPNAGRVGGGSVERIQRQRQGGPGDTALAAEPTGTLTPRLGDEVPLSTYRSRVGDAPNLAPITANPGTVRSASAPGSNGTQTAAAALPEGSNLEGEVSGRALSSVPDPPVSEGSDGGTAKLQFEVKPNGQVYNVVVKEKPGSPLLERLAKEWVQKLRFAPLSGDSDQKTQSGEITVVFKKE